MTNTEKPIQQISAQAAGVLRVMIMSRVDQITRLYNGAGREEMFQGLRHLCAEMGIDTAGLVPEPFQARECDHCGHVDGDHAPKCRNY